MSLLRLLARPMLAATFVADGVDSVIHPEAHAEKLRKAEPLLRRAGVPPALYADPKMLARVVGAVSAVSGLMLATGRRPRSAAFTLALLNVPMTLLNNPVWATKDSTERRRHLAGLVRGASLGGGLLVAAADLAGRPSLGWRMANTREHRADLRRAKAAVRARYTD